MPVRKIKMNHFSVTGVFYSFKNDRHIEFESSLERDFFLLLEMDETVEFYEEQPMTLYYIYLNRKTPYTPDCIIHYCDENRPSCIVEVKPSKVIKDKKVFLKQKFEQIEQYLHKNDMDFKLFTEFDIRTQRLENCKYIYGFADIQDNQNYIDTITNIVKKAKEICFLDLQNGCSDDKYIQASYTPYIWHLIYKRVLAIDMNQAISNNSSIRLHHGNA